MRRLTVPSVIVRAPVTGMNDRWRSEDFDTTALLSDAERTLSSLRPVLRRVAALGVRSSSSGIG